METSHHSLSSLFDQLGLPSSSSEIDRFIDEHRPLPRQVELHAATFWSESQSKFLQQTLNDDADWAEIVDQLNTRLR